MEPTNFQLYLEEAKDLYNNGYDIDFIENHFKHKGKDVNEVTEIIKELKIIRNAKRTKTGTKLIILGVLFLGIGGVSCVIIHFFGGEIEFELYGLTIIGMTVLIAGLIYIFI